MWQRFAYLLGRAVRETGQALDRAGYVLQGNFAFKEQLSRHRRLMPLYNQRPKLQNDVFVAPSASVIGDVAIGERATIWYGSVLRGDVNNISVGRNTSIGDNCVIHVSSEHSSTGAKNARIGNNVVVESGTILHACEVQDNSKVGSGSIIFDGAVIQSQAEVGAGSLIPTGKIVPSGQLWAGRPAQYVRDLTEAERAKNSSLADEYYNLGRKHLAEHKLTEGDREDRRESVHFDHQRN